MGFTTPVFILKNTPELRDKLVRLGYKIGYERYINDDFLATDNDEMFGIDVPYPPEQCNGYIHCGTNEALFLAIAALRDDTDDSQWFVYPPEIFGLYAMTMTSIMHEKILKIVYRRHGSIVVIRQR